MIAFGCAITDREVFRRSAERGIQLAAEPDSVVLALDSRGSLMHNYNLLLEQAAALEDLEALVLLHQDAEIADADFCARAREALSDPEVGVAGSVGAVGARSIAWWEGAIRLASFMQRYDNHGGGELPGLSWDAADAPPYVRTGEAHTLDGFLLVISPWVVRNVRFDESLGAIHGYDFDFCLQVREAGRKVVTADLRAYHDHALEAFRDPQSWIDAHVRVAEKWDGRMPGVGRAPGSWRERALRAEAERDCAHVMAHSAELLSSAEIAALEHALAETRQSLSWRLTAPLRALRRLGPQRPAPRRRLRADLSLSARAGSGGS